MKKTLPYREGAWFGVPLRHGGYAVGVVARMRPRGKVILGYLFGPKREAMPTLAELASLRPEDAIKCLRMGDLGLVNGVWPVIGELPEWHRDAWGMPAFVRRDKLSTRAKRIIYSDSDPSLDGIEREESVPYDITGLEEDALYGYGSVELKLTKLLDGSLA